MVRVGLDDLARLRFGQCGLLCEQAPSMRDRLVERCIFRLSCAAFHQKLRSVYSVTATSLVRPLTVT
jgi:hypothetical protein